MNVLVPLTPQQAEHTITRSLAFHARPSNPHANPVACATIMVVSIAYSK